MAVCIGSKVKDIHFLLEMSLTELKKLKWFIVNSTIEYNGELEEEQEGVRYITEEFLPFLNKLIEDAENGS